MAPHSVILSSMAISGEPAKHAEEFMRAKFPVKLPANIWVKHFLKPVEPDLHIKVDMYEMIAEL